MGLHFPDRKITIDPVIQVKRAEVLATEAADIASRSAHGSRQAIVDLVNLPYTAFQYITGTSSQLGEIAPLSRFGGQYDLDRLYADNFFTRTADVIDHVVYGGFDFVFGHLPYLALEAVGLKMPYFSPPETTAEGRAYELTNAIFLGLTPAGMRVARRHLGMAQKPIPLFKQARAVQLASGVVGRARAAAVAWVLHAAAAAAVRQVQNSVARVHARLTAYWTGTPTWLRNVVGQRGMITVPRVFGPDSRLLTNAEAVMREAIMDGPRDAAREGPPPHLDTMAVRVRIEYLGHSDHTHPYSRGASSVLEELIKIAEELARPEIHRVMGLADILALFNRMVEIAAKLPISWEAQIKLAGLMGQVGFRSRSAAIIGPLLKNHPLHWTWTIELALQAISQSDLPAFDRLPLYERLMADARHVTGDIPMASSVVAVATEMVRNGNRAKALAALQKAALEWTMGGPGRNLILRAMADLGFYKEVVQLLKSDVAKQVNCYPQKFLKIVDELVPLLNTLPQAVTDPFFRVLMDITGQGQVLTTRAPAFRFIAEVYDRLGQKALSRKAADAAIQAAYQDEGFISRTATEYVIEKVSRLSGLATQSTGRLKKYFLQAAASEARLIADQYRRCRELNNVALIADGTAEALFDEVIVAVRQLPVAQQAHFAKESMGLIQGMVDKSLHQKAGTFLQDLEAAANKGLTGIDKGYALADIERARQLLNP